MKCKRNEDGKMKERRVGTFMSFPRQIIDMSMSPRGGAAAQRFESGTSRLYSSPTCVSKTETDCLILSQEIYMYTYQINRNLQVKDLHLPIDPDNSDHQSDANYSYTVMH